MENTNRFYKYVTELLCRPNYVDHTGIQTIPPLDTSAVTIASTMFNGCSSIQTIPALNVCSETLRANNNLGIK